MKCPFCGELEDKVIDSRVSQEGGTIRRRRECVVCGRRFTTYERVEEILPLVVKKDGTRQPFDRQKVLAGVQRACVKRPVTGEMLEELVSDVERLLQESGEKEIPSKAIGEAILERLQPLDDVAYVRFASVYREFRDVGEFLKELSALEGRQAKKG
ncbi:transcriptional regulator NrdR [Vulgatibacter incomptus]|uniref:Transcriptional repressor NrdR n=1 Tax=Vulgatibacter incomptus TaxID=1391653 RepID=A0A0K1PDQ7_9BACT|nr:transcriptional regulator NrdR [Vulgatibacter incomptus]AKU91239.1 Ribonucleotide reductase transcriptional regulator NrdR [Vulgatibacter incomptus]